MFKYLVAIVMALMLAACNGHAGSSDPLTGMWGIKNGDTIKPLMKVEKNGDQYAVSHYENGNWVPLTQQVKPMAPDDLAKLSGHKEPDSVVGIKGNSFAFFHTPVGWSAHGFSTKTGYVVFVPFKLVDLQRMS